MRPRNVLVMLADDLGSQEFSAYGVIPGGQARTPVIRQLALGGVLFRNAWSNPICSPTRASLLTGRHPFRTGMGFAVHVASGHELPAAELTLPEALGMHPSLTYQTAAFGKWHLGADLLGANLAGFDHFDGALGNLGNESYYAWTRIIDGQTSTSNEYATSRTVDSAIAWIDSAVEPWVCYVAFHGSHAPWHEPPPDLYSTQTPNVEPREDPRPFFVAATEALDTEIGRLLAALGPSREHTNVIFISDNGTPRDVCEPLAEPLHGKISPYEAGVRVPFIVNGPIVSQPGRQVDALVQATDVFATVLSMTGMDPVGDLPPGHVTDSMDLGPYLHGRGPLPVRSHAYSELFHPNFSVTPDVHWRLVRDQRYKLIRRLSSPDELYDLALDPDETSDLLLGSPDATIQAVHQSLLDAIDSIESS